MTARILVTGATGAIGPRVVEAFHSDGQPVRILSRSVPRSRLLPDHIDICLGDVTEPEAVQAAMQGVEAVVHLAGLLHNVDQPPALREEYERINVGGTTNILDAAVQAGVGRLVFFSTIAVYGDTAGQIVTEGTPARPDTFYARTKFAAEQHVLQAHRRDGHPLGTVLRLGAVYGARVKGNYQRLVQALARGRFVPIGDGSNRRTLIYDCDAARAAVLAVRHPAAAGEVYNVSDVQFHTLDEIINTICEALQCAPPRFAVPQGLARFTAGALEDLARLAGRRSPVGRATIDKYTEDVAVDSRRFQTHLGFEPRYDLRTGWEEAIQGMRQEGTL